MFIKNEKKKEKLFLDSYDLDNFSLKEYEDLIFFMARKIMFIFQGLMEEDGLKMKLVVKDINFFKLVLH